MAAKPKEIKISSHVGGRIITGVYWEHGRMVTVRLPDGRTKTTQIGGSPAAAIARVLLREMEQAKRI